MITVDQAIELVQKHGKASHKKKSILVDKTVGHILAQDIIAPISLPSFQQSSMDGFAVRFRESDSNTYTIIGEVQAGDATDYEMKPGDAVRIFTGARVPDTADAVVMQERTSVIGQQLELTHPPKPRENIRAIGGQIKEGSIPLEKGHFITPSSVGLLKSLGFETVVVNTQPKVSIIVTGNELVTAGSEIKEGQVYESNSAVLETALKQRGITDVTIATAKDTLQETEAVLGTALQSSDLVLISGGISVGDYDFVGTALKRLNVEEVFYKVLQKPGKPLFFGKMKDTFVFALPGNPASTLTCFYVYVHLLLDQLVGAENTGLLRVQIPLATDFENTFNRALFLKARVRSNHVEILDFQNSATMITFAKANALVYIPETTTSLKQGALVETILLPYGSSN